MEPVESSAAIITTCGSVARQEWKHMEMVPRAEAEVRRRVDCGGIQTNRPVPRRQPLMLPICARVRSRGREPTATLLQIRAFHFLATIMGPARL